MTLDRLRPIRSMKTGVFFSSDDDFGSAETNEKYEKQFGARQEKDSRHGHGSGREQRQPEVMIKKELLQVEDASLKARWLSNRALESRRFQIVQDRLAWTKKQD